ncbi:MAG TPA: DVUA0089 family protein [Nitrosospira sp.]|nr:DVUA0089 family protein [Nitrosospira sp.]
MDSKLDHGYFRIAAAASLLTAALLVTLLAGPAHAVNWTEVGDAGDLLGTAQEPMGDGSLRNIYGTISTNADVDLYRIFISDPTSFSASVTSTSGNFDSVLALFNGGGYGVYANDDARLGDRNAGLPAGSFLGPQAPGWYYLAVFGLDTTPTSGNGFTPDHYIGPEVSAPFTQIIGASGPGGASPLTGWAPVDSDDVASINEGYRLRLSGTMVSAVPEPETYAMLLAGLGLIGTMVRRRSSSIG